MRTNLSRSKALFCASVRVKPRPSKSPSAARAVARSSGASTRAFALGTSAAGGISAKDATGASGQGAAREGRQRAGRRSRAGKGRIVFIFGDRVETNEGPEETAAFVEGLTYTISGA